MFIKDLYLHSKLQHITGSEQRVSVRKDLILSYKEYGSGSILETEERDFIIEMTYDEVRLALQIKTVEIVGSAS